MIDSYREKGSSVELNVASQRYEVGELGIGARLAAAFDLGQGSLEPEARVMAWHDFIADKANTTSTFVLGAHHSPPAVPRRYATATKRAWVVPTTT